jgi:HEAT repeat protein
VRENPAADFGAGPVPTPLLGTPEEDMFRTASRIFPTLRSLLLGAAVASGVTVAAGAVAGCGGDENDPTTHVKKLSDPATRVPAVSRLVQFFEDAMTKDNKDRNGANVKPLLDKIVEPMSQICATGDLDEKTQSKVVKFLSDARDPRGAPCLIKTLKDYKPDSTEEDVRAAARGVGPMKVKEAAGPLFEAFTKLRHSKPKASLITRDVHDALIELADPSWEAQCTTMIGKPIADRKDINVLKDEFYHQITCAEILGTIKATGAVKPLIKIVLSPVKADAQATAIYALIKIGKPAIEPAVKLMQGADADLVEYAKVEYLKGNTGEDGKVPEAATKAAPTAYLAPAALILGSIGRDEAVQPMIDSIAKADDVGKVVIGRELLKLPTSQASLDAVKTVYEKTPITLTIPPGNGAREAVLESFGDLFDASLVPWLVKTALDARGEDADLEPVRASTLVTVMKLMKADQIAEVDKLAESKINGPDGKPSTLGKGYEKEYKIAKDLLKECGDKLECFYGKLSDPNSHVGDKQFIGIKSAYMIGILGGPEARTKLVELMPKVTNAGAKFAAVKVIDRRSAKGDPTIAAQLQKLVDEADATKDGTKIAAVAPFKMVVYRLNARSQ